jgi:hypothetical protein
MRKEDSLAQQVATYLNTQYPKVIYHFDTGSGGRTTIGLAMRNKRLNKWRGYPDLFICECKGLYGGLFIELKAESIFKKDGELKKNAHIEEQRDVLNNLMSKGYYAMFGVGFEDCKRIIDEYLKLSK